jgi:NADPH-dependent 2,4-dienoyl-CoA reductase/sulfur reductase-like enzyme
MTERRYDTLVLGGGSAGLAAALEVAQRGFSVAVLEREHELGGILNQCIHNGFGLHRFKQDLTGPEYAERFIEKVEAHAGIDLFLDTTALEAEVDGSPVVYGYSGRYGILQLRARTVILAMGCRERNRGNIGIPGTRPAGVYTAGLAQRLINIDGLVPGRRAVVVGSGDIGLIMARRLSWVGTEVLGVVEIQPYPSGLTRNIVQCLNDFSIPLYLSHVVAEVYGKDRVTGVRVAPVVDGHPDEAEAFRLDCDTILLSVGLIPDNELSKKLGVELNPETGGAIVDAGLMSSVEGVFACGNVLHVHDLVDWVTEEAETCGASAARYLDGAYNREQRRVVPGANVKYVVPGRCFPKAANRFYLRALIVKNHAELLVKIDGEPVKRKRLAHVQPSEMVSFTLEPEELPAAKGLEEPHIEVSIQ